MDPIPPLNSDILNCVQRERKGSKIKFHNPLCSNDVQPWDCNQLLNHRWSRENNYCLSYCFCILCAVQIHAIFMINNIHTKMACTITVQLDRRRNHVKVAGEEDRTITRDQENASVSRSLICIFLKRK